MNRAELTFNAVDDLTEAYLRGKLPSPGPGQAFCPNRLGPLIELALQSSTGRVGPFLASPWLDRAGQAELRLMLTSPANHWYGNTRDTGFQRTTFDPMAEADDATRIGFLVAASAAAQRAGFHVKIAQSLAAAMRELESNVHEHSELPETGILAFQAGPGIFEFVAADCGVGVLATLQDSPDYPDLRDHGLALQEVLKPGVSRYGRAASRGNGFRDLFVGLASLNADLRFRSGDHALTISGENPDLKTARLAQKPFFQGFAASIRCALPLAQQPLH